MNIPREDKPREQSRSLLEDIEKLRELMKPTISQEEAETYQQWDKLDGATAFHLIERHAANWADTRLMMEAWLRANTPRSSCPPSEPQWTPTYDAEGNWSCVLPPCWLLIENQGSDPWIAHWAVGRPMPMYATQHRVIGYYQPPMPKASRAAIAVPECADTMKKPADYDELAAAHPIPAAPAEGPMPSDAHELAIDTLESIMVGPGEKSWGERAQGLARSYLLLERELAEAKKWQGVMTEIADKTQQRLAAMEARSASAPTRIEKAARKYVWSHKFLGGGASDTETRADAWKEMVAAIEERAPLSAIAGSKS